MVKIIITDEYLEKINKVAFALEREGFFIDKIDYNLGYIYGNAEFPQRLKNLNFIQEIIEINVPQVA